MHLLLAILATIASSATTTHIWGGMLCDLTFLPNTVRRAGHDLHMETKPFLWPAIAMAVGYTLSPLNPERVSWGTYLSCVCVIGYGLIYKHDDGDDRWKRRARKAREAIERRGSRLVVVPATGGAR